MLLSQSVGKDTNFPRHGQTFVALTVMTAVQLNAMNTELWQSIGAIADSELLMKRLTRYAKKLVKERVASKPAPV